MMPLTTATIIKQWMNEWSSSSNKQRNWISRANNNNKKNRKDLVVVVNMYMCGNWLEKKENQINAFHLQKKIKIKNENQPSTLGQSISMTILSLVHFLKFKDLIIQLSSSSSFTLLACTLTPINLCCFFSKKNKTPRIYMI